MSADMKEGDESLDLRGMNRDPEGEDHTEEEVTIVQAALRKVANQRQLILRQGDPVTPSPALTELVSPISAHGEQIRALRTSLLMLNEGHTTGAHMLAVVSPCGGEGRSQIAAELAMSFAQLGQSTLLVDADMRRPSLHKMFDCTSSLGLADGLMHRAPPHTHPVQGMERFDFIAAGNPPQSNPLELFSDHRFAGMVYDWRNRYAFVIIDTPAVSEYADALAIAAVTGRVLAVARAKQTPYKKVKEMMRRLAITQSRVVGAVMSHF